MEKYKYCNIGPASSPRVGGREGGKGLCMIDKSDSKSRWGRKGTEFFFSFRREAGNSKMDHQFEYKFFPHLSLNS